MLTKALISSHTPRFLYPLIFSTEEGLGIAKIPVQHFSGNQVEGGHGRLVKKMVGPLFSVHAWRSSRSCISMKAVQPESAFSLVVMAKSGLDLCTGVTCHSILMASEFYLGALLVASLPSMVIMGPWVARVTVPSISSVTLRLLHPPHFLIPSILLLWVGWGDPKPLVNIF